MIYDANLDVRHAIFMAAPHRGSRKASNAIGKLGTALGRLPRNAVKNATTLNVGGLTELGKQRLTHVPDSIVEMRPQDPYLMAVLNEPLSHV